MLKPTNTKKNQKVQQNVFNRQRNWQQLRLLTQQIFAKDKNILFILKPRHAQSETMLRHLIKKNGFAAIYIWTHGFITNFAEVLMSYRGNKGQYKHENILDLRWGNVDTIFFTNLPTNTDTIKEWLLLKRVLNIKIAAIVNHDNNSERQLCWPSKNGRTTLIDHAIYYGQGYLTKHEVNLFLQQILRNR